jgi:hypothetical protein
LQFYKCVVQATGKTGWTLEEVYSRSNPVGQHQPHFSSHPVLHQAVDVDYQISKVSWRAGWYLNQLSFHFALVMKLFRVQSLMALSYAL